MHSALLSLTQGAQRLLPPRPRGLRAPDHGPAPIDDRRLGSRTERRMVSRAVGGGVIWRKVAKIGKTERILQMVRIEAWLDCRAFSLDCSREFSPPTSAPCDPHNKALE